MEISTKSAKHVGVNVNTRKENQNSNNKVEDIMLKGHPMP
jgi:hypothetical protein